MIRLAALAATIVLALAPGAALAQAERGDGVLERFAIAEGSTYELATASCQRDECAVELRLTAAGRVIARHETGWRVAAGAGTRADREAASAIREAGAPRTLAWQFGAETTQSLLAVRPVRLAAGAQALLLMEMGGFEHVKRRFMIVLARGNALRRVWQDGDGAGPFASWIELPQGRVDQPVFFRALAHPEPAELDTLRVRELRWTGRSIGQRRARGLWAVVGGFHQDAAAARAARERAPQTGGNFWVLAPAMLLRRQDGRAALIALTSHEAHARTLLAEARGAGFPQAILTRANPSRR